MQGSGSAFENGLSVAIDLVKIHCNENVNINELSPILEVIKAHLGNRMNKFDMQITFVRC